MTNYHAELIEKLLVDGVKYKAHSHTVPGVFLKSLLDQLRHDESAIETLRELLRIERIRGTPATTDESKP